MAALTSTRILRPNPKSNYTYNEDTHHKDPHSKFATTKSTLSRYNLPWNLRSRNTPSRDFYPQPNRAERRRPYERTHPFGRRSLAGIPSNPKANNCTRLDSIIASLDTVDTKQKYKPVPDEVLHLIRRLCREHQVDIPVWAQSPANWREIRILGRGVTAIQEQLEKEAKTLYPEFKFVTKESGPIHTKQFRGLTVQQLRLRADEGPGSWVSVAGGRCELILSGVDRTLSHFGNNRRPYFVIPAHVILSDDQCREILESPDPLVIDQIRQAVNSQVFSTRYILNLAPDDKSQQYNMNERVMIAYRHFYRNVSITSNAANYRCPGGKCRANELPTCPHMHMNDIAILSISGQEYEQLHPEISANERFHFEEILALTLEDVDKLIDTSVKVYVGELECKLVPRPRSVADETAEKTYADHVAFIVQHPAREVLTEGSSGSILHIKHRGTKLAFAMFIGELDGFPGHYQAILLKQALRDIELDYRHHVGDFEPFKFEPGNGPRPVEVNRPMPV